jgi:dihydroorotate dehydrogenase (fumarate)
MDLSTTCMGLRLRTPIVVGASPLADDVSRARALEDAGAGAIVMRSIFAEQLGAKTDAAALPTAGVSPYEGAFVRDPEDYLRQIGRLKEALSVPVFASLNGSSPGPWLEFAGEMCAAGADGIEVNLYALASDPSLDGRAVERQALDVVREVKKRAGKAPVAVKIAPFYSALAHFTGQLAAAGADGLVLFARPFEEDVDPNGPFVEPGHQISRVSEIELRLRWLTVLSRLGGPSLLAVGGVHDGRAVVKAILAGAHAVQMVSAILARGPLCVSEALAEVRDHLDRGYESIAAIRGTLDLRGFPDPAAYERLSYALGLQRWREWNPAAKA